MTPTPPRTLMKTPKKSPSSLMLPILALIMVLNALSYGMIIPLTYPLAEKFGLGPTGLGWLIASFSLAQFLATPVIGRLSDRFGRKPLLLLSVLGSAISMVLLALAQAAPMLFLARIFDGITGGNNSVAQAAIADVTPEKDRAKAFGMLGAAFGFGFLFGPAIGGFLGGISFALPFWFAAGLAGLAVILGLIFFPETLRPGLRRTVKLEQLFHGKQLILALFSPALGSLFLLTLLISAAQSSFIVGAQTISFDVLKLTSSQFGLILTVVGLVSVIMQVGVIRVLLKIFKRQEFLLTLALIGSVVTLVALFYFHQNLNWLIFLNIFYTIFASPGMPVISGLISQRTQTADQGLGLGLNQAYMAMGMIIGPLLAGLVAETGLSHVFLLSAGLLVLGLVAAKNLFVKVKPVNL